MLNILPLSILQAWGLWPDFDGVHTVYPDESVIGMDEVIANGQGPVRSEGEIALPRESDGSVTIGPRPMGPGEQSSGAFDEDDLMLIETLGLA